MALNIKNERVCALAKEAAERIGTSQTSAVELALEKLLADVRAKDSTAEKRRKVDEILARIDAVITDEDRAAMTTDFLYDENGLPK